MEKPDHAGQAVADIKESGDYTLIQHVPVFDEHEEFDKDGKLIRKVDKEKLKDIKAKADTKEKKHGDLTPVGIGHTKPLPAPETEQPPIIGYACNYSVEKDSRSGKWTLFQDWWIENDKLGELKKYPRRSVELWKMRGDIDWVAILKRSPDRPLGLLMPDVGESDVLPRYLRPDRTGPMAFERESAGDVKLYYSMESPMADPTMPPSAAPGQAPGAPSEGQQPDEYSRMKGHMQRYMAESYPQLGDMCAKHAAGCGGAPGGAPPAGGSAGAAPGGAPAAPAYASPTNTHLPAPEPRRFSAEEQIVEDAKKLAEQAEYAKKNDDVTRFARLEEQVKDQEKRYQTERVKRLVDPLRAAGYMQNWERLETDLLPMDEKQRYERIEEVTKYSRQDPAKAGRGFIPVAGPIGVEGRREEDDPHNVPDGKLDEYMQFCREGKTIEEALHLVRGDKNGVVK